MHIHYNAHSGVMVDSSVYVDIEFLAQNILHDIMKFGKPYG
jgi:hypothetical protein